MIISNIIGGLGNQMFQYALGRATSIKNNIPLKLDTANYTSYGLHHGFELHNTFNVNADLASKADVHSILGWQSSSICKRVLLKSSMSVFRRGKFIVEPYFHYWDAINNLGNDCYLHGYWQSEKYFLDIADQIRQDFIFRQPISKKNINTFNNISKVNAVSLHIRRGDYVSNSQNLSIYGLYSLEYYKAAIQYISSKVFNPHFYVFSDDIDWVRLNLRINFPTLYVDHNTGIESYNDMRLMSLCKHNIIANSSFSWWGAWLNQYASKIVIAPKKWFANGTDVKDLLPESWVKL